MSDPIRAAELEGRLILATGIAPGNSRVDAPYMAMTDVATNRSLLRDWLIAKGVDKFVALKQSDLVLRNAYHGGDKYIAKIGTEAPTSSGFGRRPSARLRRLAVSLDEPTAELLEAKPTVSAPPAPSFGEGETQKLETQKLDQTAVDQILAQLRPKLANAADAVLTARIADAKNDLRRDVKNDLDDLLDNAIAEAQKSVAEAARETARAEAERVIREQTPQRIVIVRGAERRELSAEPRHEKFDEILRWLLSGEHVYIVGPAGTGKTHLFEQLATAINKRQFSIGQALTKYDVSGFKGPTGEYIGTIAREAIETGGLLTIDEGDMWAAAALGFLNQPLANGYCAFPDKVVEVHPDFQCMIAANTFGRGATSQYIGRNPLDAASLDRFAYVEVDYDEKLERQLYGNGPWTQYVQRVRRAVREQRLPHVVSMRATARAIRGAAAGHDPQTIAFGSLWRGLEPDTIAKIKSLAGREPTAEIVDLTGSED